MKKLPPLPALAPTNDFLPVAPTARPGLFGSSQRVRQGEVVPDVVPTNPAPYPFALSPTALGPDALAALAIRPAAQPPLPVRAWARAAGAGVSHDILLTGAKIPFGPAERASGRPDHRLPPEVIAAAQASQRNTGVPASVSIAQWIWESGWGQHIPKNSNNYFGIKAFDPKVPGVEQRTFEDDPKTGEHVSKMQRFRRFASAEESWTAHAKLLSTEHQYAKAMALKDDPDKFVDAIAGIYAPGNRTYAPSIKSTMRSNRLYQYDVPTPEGR